MKFKKIPNEYFITILDRLTRFEPAYVRYKRVFDDIINKFFLGDKLKNLTLEEEINIVENIFNSSVDANNDFFINSVLTELEEKYFTSSPISYQYLSARLNLSAMVSYFENKSNLPKNVEWLKNINTNKNVDIYKLRKENNLLFPIEKIILCEGQTEYTLLDTMFNLFNINLDALGMLIIPAGGKNQVAKKYYQMLEYVKLPFYILLDKDALLTSELIEPKLRSIDKLYLIKSGEFEDLIPKNILQNTINAYHCSDFNCIWDDFDDSQSMVKNLENIYKKYGFGEFKKAKFAQNLKEYIQNNCTKDDFANSEIVEIINSL